MRREDIEKVIDEFVSGDQSIVDDKIFKPLEDINKKKFRYFGKEAKIIAPTQIVNPQNIILGDFASIREYSFINMLRHATKSIGFINEHYPDNLSEVDVNDYIFGEPVLEIGEGSSIGRFALINCNQKIDIGKNVLISERLFISDNTHRYENSKLPIMFQSQTKGEPIEIGDFSWIGIGVTILPGVKIGRHCIVAANTVVTNDVPDYCMVAGNPARIVKKINSTYLNKKEAIPTDLNIEGASLYEKLRNYIVSSFPKVANHIDGPIFKDGTIDSFGFLDILCFIENDLNISINELEIISQNITSLKEMVTYVVVKNNKENAALNCQFSGNSSSVPEIDTKREKQDYNQAFIDEYRSLEKLDNICIQEYLLTRHNPSSIAFIFIDNGKETKYTYQEVIDITGKTCNLFQSIGLGPDDTVLICSEPSEKLYFSTISLLIMGIKFTITYEEIGYEALNYRFEDCKATAIFITNKHVEKFMNAKIKFDKIRVICFDEPGNLGFINYAEEIKKFESNYDSPTIDINKIAFCQYTSGTTGNAKGAIHSYNALKLQYLTSKYILGLKEGVRYTCSASLGWITGIVYGLIGPLLTGCTNVINNTGSKQTLDWLKIIDEQEIVVFYTAPTLIRYLMSENVQKVKRYELKALKRIYAVGEALNRECVDWGLQVLNKHIYNTWFQTELGSIIISNDNDSLYSMGKSLPGKEVVIKQDSNGVNMLCLKPDFFSFFKGYLNREKTFKEKFTDDGYYITGDVANIDDNGYYHFVSRNDDIINTAGHLVSPFEVENIIMEFPEVLEVAVVGINDNLLYEKVKAFLSLKKEVSEEQKKKLFEEIRNAVRSKLSAFAVPREIEIINQFPKTSSGKIIRSELKGKK